jgi:hypothetical protein
LSFEKKRFIEKQFVLEHVEVKEWTNTNDISQTYHKRRSFILVKELIKFEFRDIHDPHFQCQTRVIDNLNTVIRKHEIIFFNENSEGF